MSSFRKRNVVISKKGDAPAASSQQKQSLPGVRPSPVTGHATTSTGTESLDKLLGLGAGIALGSSLVIEEEGTTEFARSLLSCYAAEGVLQGHHVFVVGPEGSLTLPGLAENDSKSKRSASVESEKMKIAWRYERLGAFEERGPPRQQSSAESTGEAMPHDTSQAFCHTFDLTKRLTIPSSSQPPKYLAPSTSAAAASPFAPVLSLITAHLSSATTPTRLIIPALLSPLIYPPTASQPHHLLQFLHQLRALLRRHATLTVMMTWPLALYPGTHPLTRWSRHLVDGVITLRPFPHSFSIDAVDLDTGSSDSKGKAEEKMQGLIKVLKLPISTEKGISVGVGEDMAFAVGRRRFLIRPFHLPPLESDDGGGDGGAGHDHSHEAGGATKVEAKSLDF